MTDLYAYLYAEPPITEEEYVMLQVSLLGAFFRFNHDSMYSKRNGHTIANTNLNRYKAHLKWK